MSRRQKTIYWTTTGLVCGVMAFSAVNFNLEKPFGPFERPFEHLGLPDYLRIELSIAKALGVLALLVPSVPRKIKEFAYAGSGITFISASIAHFSTGDPILFVIDPLLFFAALVVSYSYFTKANRDVSAVKATAPDASLRHVEATAADTSHGLLAAVRR